MLRFYLRSKKRNKDMDPRWTKKRGYKERIKDTAINGSSINQLLKIKNDGKIRILLQSKCGGPGQRLFAREQRECE